MKKQFSTFLITSTLLTIGVFVLTSQAYAEMEVSGNITSDTIWTLDNSPYIVTNTVLVLGGITLTIEPGVTINFNQDTSLGVGGKLVAIGTEDKKIIFHGGSVEFNDTSVDAVTDQNDNYINGSIIKYSIIEPERMVGLNIRQANPFISNNTIKNMHNTAGVNAIHLYYSNSIVANNFIDNNYGTAINVYFSGAKIKNNSITNNLTAFNISGGSPEISKNIIKNNYSGFYLQFHLIQKFNIIIYLKMETIILEWLKI